MVLTFGSVGAIGLCSSIGSSFRSFERVATELQAELASTASHAIPTSEIRLPVEQGELRRPTFSDSERRKPSIQPSRAPDFDSQNQTFADKRHSIRLMCRGPRASHASDEPPEQPRSLC